MPSFSIPVMRLQNSELGDNIDTEGKIKVKFLNKIFIVGMKHAQIYYSIC